ncbi:ABC transporter substrate-binding protein, partial [Rhodococcus sp. NPDC049939]|uniref:ABC transporter substrate-binding protein n=1 Tax=Rhodococcus sp. NPDC049939 TaxID=3155511 RepID=UPI0033E6C07A
MLSSAGAKVRVLAALLLAAVLVLASCSTGENTSGTAARDLCSPPGPGSATAAPTNVETASGPAAVDRYTTDNVVPLDQIDTSRLNLITPGVLTVGTLTDAPPSICINSESQFSGYDNELLKAIAAKLGLQINFVGTDFAGLLAQVAARRFDVGSSSITTTDERRATVGFTNGYDFGYFSLVAATDGPIQSFSDLNSSTRIGVVQGTVQDDYVENTLGLDPVKFPDYATAYANLLSGQIDAWVAPSQQALGIISPGDPVAIVQDTFSINNFMGWAVAQENQPLIDALNSGLDAIIADGTWARLYSDWVPRPLPEGWKPGSKAAPTPDLPDFAALAALNPQNTAETPAAQPKSTLQQLKDTFFNWDLYVRAFPDLLK